MMDYLYFRGLSMGVFINIIIILTIAVTKSRTQDNFYFDPPPLDNQPVVQGSEAILRCDVSNRKHIKFYWAMDDRQLQNTSRRFQEDSNLRILRVDREEDAGSFRCIATNVTTGVSLRSVEAYLDIQWIAKSAKVDLRTPKSSSKIVENTTISLKCDIDGNPEPSIQWFRNGIRLTTTPDQKFRLHKSRLKITNATSKENGIYSCRADNTAGMRNSIENFLLNIEGRNSARLIADTFKETVLLNEGETAFFDCQYENAILTEWYTQDDRLIKNNSKTTVYQNGTLAVKNVELDDIGLYKCTGISTSGAVSDQTFVSELRLTYLNEFSADSFDPRVAPGEIKVVPENQRFEIRCFAPNGMPEPTQRWVDPLGQPIPDTGRIRVEEDRLYMNNVQESDSGNYTCIASNQAGDKYGPVHIVVSVPPTISRPPLSTRVEEDGDAQFDCKMAGTPHPVSVITWKKENEPIDVSHPRFVVDQKEGALKIKGVHLSDEGNYACTVNTTGHKPITSTNAHLYVKKKLKFKPRPVNTKLELGSTAKVYCNAEGQSIPEIKWAKADGSEFPEHLEDAAGILVFKGVRHSDKGSYTCTATSVQGKINATIVIDVVVKPRFKVKPMNTTVFEGYSIMMHCVAIGDPTPTIQWDKNSNLNGFDPGRFKLLSNGSLYISEAYMEDMGKYGCTAGNSGGFEREEVYLHVASAENQAGAGRYIPKDDAFSMMKTIIIAVCCAVAYLAIVIGLTVYCSIRLVRAKNLRKAAEAEADADKDGKAENGVIPSERTELMEKKERDSSIVKSDCDARSHVSGVSSHQSHSSRSQGSRSQDKYNFPRHDLQTLGMLGKGHYGDVFLAKAHGIKDGGDDGTLVVVKSLLTRDESHHFEFRREMDMFGKLNHEHIVKLMGVCREMEPQFLITEYCDWGDLKQFLRATRRDNGKRNVNIPPLTIAQKVTMCNQVALGMEHLSNHRFIHKDLAARNILLSSTLDLKISNLALCRDVYAPEYFAFQHQLIPLRWMPPEAVLDDEYSTKSDVWSWGVFAWEVFMLGDIPYRNETNEEVLKCLKNAEYRLDPPYACPEEIHSLMLRCWSENPRERPSFSEIVLQLLEVQVDSDV